MIGLLILSKLGFINLYGILINPTYLWAAIIGGAIMGLGFIIGGFCPGTGICAAATGRIDGITFTIGLLIGVFLFTEFFPALESIFYAEYWGAIYIYDYYEISKEAAGMTMIIIAASAFIGTQLIENKVNGKPTIWTRNKCYRYGAIIAIPIICILVLIISPDTNNQTHDEKTNKTHKQ